MLRDECERGGKSEISGFDIEKIAVEFTENRILESSSSGGHKNG